MESDRVFPASAFSTFACKRDGDGREDTHVQLCRVSVCAWRRLRRKVHDSRTQCLRYWGWRAPRSSDIDSSLNFECPRAVSDRYDTLGIRFISWNAARISLICITQSSRCALRFALTIVVVVIRDVSRNYFASASFLVVFSSKNVSQSFVYVTFDLVLVTKIFKHWWQVNHRRRKEMRQDSEKRTRCRVGPRHSFSYGSRVMFAR